MWLLQIMFCLKQVNYGMKHCLNCKLCFSNVWQGLDSLLQVEQTVQKAKMNCMFLFLVIGIFLNISFSEFSSNFSICFLCFNDYIVSVKFLAGCQQNVSSSHNNLIIPTFMNAFFLEKQCLMCFNRLLICVWPSF